MNKLDDINGASPMGKHINSLIFISYASDDSKLAILIKELFHKSLNVVKETIFCSSDIESIRMDDVQYEKITKALQSAKAVIVLMTPNSIYRPWVLFEAGGAHFFKLGSTKKNPKRLFLVYANGINPESLPAPLQPRQARDLGNRDVIRELCKEVAGKLQKSKYIIDNHITSKISTEAKKGVGGWEFVQQALVGEKISTSPFSFENLLREMKKTIFIAGQNLFHLTKNENKERYKNLLFQKLSKKDKTVRIMVCNPDFKYAVKTWQVVTADKYKEDLEHSIKVFKEWVKEAHRMKLRGTLDVRKTIIVPVSITFIDPQGESGKLVFIPVVYDPTSDWRHCYLTSKKQHPDIFNYYWTVYKEVFYNKNKTKPINVV